MNTIMRNAKFSDFNDVNNLMLELHNLHVKNRNDVFKATDSPMKEEYFKDLLNNQDVKLFVIENLENSEIVGYSNLKLMNTPNIDIVVKSKYIYIDDFCIKQAYKRKGIGKKLFNFILEYAKQQCVDSVQLNVWSFNEDAIEFYKFMGMKERNVRMEMRV
ncbi:GNAT family N-acetyltransferase [Clostridium ihumii]|uniref:GNAT family N-acetyltransferase n=1 Tax=Clostridium ihumii TaxID=1470356 RepID=UPI00058CFACE|nr:GNAT family N-acetyltransferase [Clostridium ihumii]